MTQSATSCAQIGWNSARPEPLIGTTGQQRHALEQGEEDVAGRVDDRRREDRVRDAGLGHRALGQRLGAHEARAVVRRRALGAEEDEALDAGLAARPAPCATWRPR